LSIYLSVRGLHPFEREEDGEVDPAFGGTEGEGVEELVVRKVGIGEVEFDCRFRCADRVK
jgi:hypothetical protein